MMPKNFRPQTPGKNEHGNPKFMEVWFRWFYVSIGWFWGSRTLIFRGEKNSDAPSSCCLASIWEVWQRPPSPFQTSGSNKPPIQRVVGGWQWSGEDPFKGMRIVWVYNDHWFLLSWYVDAKPLLLSNDIMKINIVCIYVYIYIHTYIYQYYSHYICLVSLAVIVLVILMSTSTMTAGKGRHTLMVTIAMGPNRCRAITSFHSRSKGQIHPFQKSTSCQKGLHPRKLTWMPKMMVWKRGVLLNMVMFGIYVKFLGGTNQTNLLHFETYPNLCNVATTSCDRPTWITSLVWFSCH